MDIINRFLYRNEYVQGTYILYFFGRDVPPSPPPPTPPLFWILPQRIHHGCSSLYRRDIPSFLFLSEHDSFFYVYCI